MIWEMLKRQEQSSSTSTKAWYPQELEKQEGGMFKKLLLASIAQVAGEVGGELLGELGGDRLG